MVDEWYSRLLDVLQKNVPIRKKHRQSLQPWISPSTSNFMKRYCSKETELYLRLSSDLILKVQNLSQQSEETATNGKKECEISPSDSRNLATIFKYINFNKSDR